MIAGTVGDIENARLVYKNAIANEEVYRLPEIWEYFLDFEASYGTVQEMLTVEGQRRAALPETAARPLDSVHAMRTRYTMLDLWPCTIGQREHIEGLQGMPRPGQKGISCVRCLHAISPIRCICMLTWKCQWLSSFTVSIMQIW